MREETFASPANVHEIRARFFFVTRLRLHGIESAALAGVRFNVSHMLI